MSCCAIPMLLQCSRFGQSCQTPKYWCKSTCLKAGNAARRCSLKCQAPSLLFISVCSHSCPSHKFQGTKHTHHQHMSEHGVQKQSLRSAKRICSILAQADSGGCACAAVSITLWLQRAAASNSQRRGHIHQLWLSVDRAAAAGDPGAAHTLCCSHGPPWKDFQARTLLPPTSTPSSQPPTSSPMSLGYLWTLFPDEPYIL